MPQRRVSKASTSGREISDLLGELDAATASWQSAEASVFAALSADCFEPYDCEFKTPTKDACSEIAVLLDRVKAAAELLFTAVAEDSEHSDAASIAEQILSELDQSGGVEPGTRSDLQKCRLAYLTKFMPEV